MASNDPNESNHIFNIDALAGLLVTLTLTQAQVYHEDRYIELLPGQKMNITNIEYPNGYPLGSARQTKIRAPHFCRIQLTCQVAVGVKSFFLYLEKS